MILGILGVVGLASNAFASQVIAVISIQGAKCNIVQNGTELASFVESGSGENRASKLVTVITSSDAPLTVTCEKEGYERGSTTVSKVLSYWTDDGIPCSPPPNTQNFDEWCSRNVGIKKQNAPVLEYPGVGVILHPAKR